MKSKIIRASTLGLLPVFAHLGASAQADATTVASAARGLSEVTVEASKLDKDLFTLTQAATIIEQEQIERSGYTDVTEILRSVPGVEFKQVGGPGQFNYIKMRGFGSANVLIVVDGVTMNLPSSGDVGNLLSQLDPSSISRIEVLRGPQTVLYGSNATAGVISITTKRGTTEPRRSISIEGGSLGWKKAKASLQQQFEMGDGKLSTSLFASHTDSDGLLRYEGTRDTTLQASADYKNKDIDVGFAVSHNKNRFRSAQLKEVTYGPNGPAYWSMQMPDPDAFNDRKSETASAYIEHRLADNLSQRLDLGWTQTRRSNGNPNNGLLGYVTAPWDNFSLDYANYHSRGDQVPFKDNGQPGTADYKDQTKQLNYSLRYAGSGYKLLGGFELYEGNARQWGIYGDLTGKNKRKSLYANGEYQSGSAGPVLAAGVRHDRYDVWGNKTTGSVGINQKIGNATIFSNFATSYAAPNLSQLYNPTYGSTNLKPESGRTVEFGVRQALADLGVNWEAMVWHAKVNDAILYDSSIPNPRNTYGGYGQYANGDELRTQGLELSGAYRINSSWQLKANYTYTDSDTKKKGKDFARTVQVARNKGNAGVGYSSGPLSVDFSAFMTNKRYDWTGVDWIPGYVRFDLSARYAVNQHLSLYTRLENLFDTKVQEGLGYKPMGFYGVVGLDYRF
ncbi:TonB-dependent receptor (plasmid) [Diaphorobacter sp. HDW4B]|uniref:TonB-dependent receptor plug domain-containing protein n=1 Tax=Diaphorobacter sp. HDW4B TaxID=2714925 RepID=UPI00140B1484|nr:TonB-dependent receptor [Diaphorobacter sp. HDW4B]QIL73816.1 TonB-dependent receptor [Diaphorobacter sp. HDW4B]